MGSEPREARKVNSLMHDPSVSSQQTAPQEGEEREAASGEARYPIREVSRLTGVNAVTLRAWQRRYGLVQPARTEKGHRLYSEQDIRHIEAILSWLERGVSIGQVKGLLGDSQSVAPSDHWQQSQESLWQLLLDLKTRQLEQGLNDLIASYPFDLVRSQLLEPVLDRLMAMTDRPDADLLRHHWLDWLAHYFGRHLVGQGKGRPLTLASWGKVGPLELLWHAYELINQGYEVQLIGPCDPRLAQLLAGRSHDNWLVLMGAAIPRGELTTPWPVGTQAMGPLGRLYPEPPQIDALQALAWQPSLADWLAMQPNPVPAGRGSGGQSRGKSAANG
jgi:MerR family transcriptional regulator, light-induced transcriptional regulator